MKCKDCVYYYADIVLDDETDEFTEIGDAYCHYGYNDGYAPCECDD